MRGSRHDCGGERAGPIRRAHQSLRTHRLLVAAFVVPLAAFALATAVAAQVKPSTSGLETEAITVSARALTSFDRTSSQSRFGRLEFRGGLVLTAESKNFGGWSGMVLDEAGRRLVAVSDAGTWMTAEIGYDGSRPVALKAARLGPLKALSQKTLRKNRDRDAEAVALASGNLANGALLISFEGNHRIGRFDIGADGVSAPRGYLTAPAELKSAKKRDGLEALTVLRGGPRKGAVVAFAEHFRDAKRNHTGWIWSGDVPQSLHLADIDEFDVTDVASLRNGDLIVLERRFRWLEGVKMRLRRVPVADVRPGALMQGEVLLEANMGQEIDNMEALAVHTDAKGETVLTLLSDDNFNGFLQRTLLLQFTLIGETPVQTAR
jgi:hypothetical protein